MNKEFVTKRIHNEMIRKWEANLTEADETRAREEESARQRKFHCDSIRKIIMDNLKYQIDKRISENIRLEQIMIGLSDNNSPLYQEISSIVVKRTEAIVELKDIATRKK